ncbi:MAG: phenylalanine--tRNA ligase subunit beta [Proteobacteria bacterium]|nr:phenylalanine--tRNA ligase subunit beta [Pseudomonadota bacterium]
MKFSEQWLREYVDPPLSTQELVDQLTMAGLEVDGFEPVAAKFSDVIVGEILSVEQHPDADKLVVCTVSNGEEALQVVCGAPNARAGIKVPFAQVGATFPDLKIKKARLRGVESNGMLCSERELGISDSHEGLMELPADAPVGTNIIEYLHLQDAVIDLDLTPNRSDCLSMIGLARETGLMNGMDVKPFAGQPIEPTIEDSFPVELVSADGCPRFVGRVIRDIDQDAVSPLWMKEKLRRAGLRSIDPVVDVTNYVMLELGQPLHAYDLAKLTGKIMVRFSAQGEKLTLLDGSEVETHADTLLITDESGPIGLAGVMGGLSTSVTAGTRDIFLEGAYFAPTAIAGRARSYGMSTDAAHRFERGVDWEGQVRAIERATELLLAIAGGQPGPTIETVDSHELPTEQTVELRASRITRMLGIEIDPVMVGDILSRLGFHAMEMEEDDELTWEVSAPSHRFDIQIEADLVEEISRVYGYNNLPVRTPETRLSMAPRSETQLSLNRLKDQLVARGYFEAVTYSFVDAGLQGTLDPAQEPISLANPLSSEMSVMRTTIWAGLLNSLIYNVNRQQPRVRLFESGLCFSQLPNQAALQFDNISQVKKLAGVSCGARQGENWANDTQAIDFYDIKGDVESLLALTGDPAAFSFAAESHSALHPGQSAAIKKDGEVVGWLGRLDPRIQQTLDIRHPIYLFELNIDSVITKKVAQHAAMSRFPEVRRDIAVIVDESVSASALFSCIEEAADDTLQNLKLFDVYQGKGIDPNRKSLALGLTFQHHSRTLTDDEINSTMESIVSSLVASFGASLRN